MDSLDLGSWQEGKSSQEKTTSGLKERNLLLGDDTKLFEAREFLRCILEEQAKVHRDIQNIIKTPSL